MIRYISVLRGINVGGKRKILMADFQTLCEEIGFSNVVTYIQSGNVIFDFNKKGTAKEVERKLTETLFKKYGFDVPVIVRTVDEIEIIIKSNPFLTESDIDHSKLHVTFLEDIPADSNSDRIKTFEYPPDRYFVIGKNVFIRCSGKYSDSKLSNNFFESKLKVTATTRNWQTVNKLFELATNNK